jgi:hypothetical protein
MNNGLPFTTRLWLFLYGYPNMAGSVLGLTGLALYFAGAIGPGWPGIVVGLYALGWLLAWQLMPRQMHLEIAREANAEALLAQLDDLIDRVRKRLPKSALDLLHSLRNTLSDLLPRLTGNEVFSRETHSVEQTVRAYLPTTLENYLRLPTVYAHMHGLSGSKTAHAMLLEQLELLDGQMKTMLHNALAEDARALAENGLFLREKFTPYDFFKIAER